MRSAAATEEIVRLAQRAAVARCCRRCRGHRRQVRVVKVTGCCRHGIVQIVQEVLVGHGRRVGVSRRLRVVSGVELGFVGRPEKAVVLLLIAEVVVRIVRAVVRRQVVVVRVIGEENGRVGAVDVRGVLRVGAVHVMVVGELLLLH